jgi:hypothetical protein
MSEKLAQHATAAQYSRGVFNNDPLSTESTAQHIARSQQKEEARIFKSGPGLENGKLDLIDEVDLKVKELKAGVSKFVEKKDLFPINENDGKEPVVDPERMDHQSFELYLQEATTLIESKAEELKQEIRGITDEKKTWGRVAGRDCDYKCKISQDIQAYVSFIVLPLKMLETAVEFAEKKAELAEKNAELAEIKAEARRNRIVYKAGQAFKRMFSRRSARIAPMM